MPHSGQDRIGVTVKGALARGYLPSLTEGEAESPDRTGSGRWRFLWDRLAWLHGDDGQTVHR